MMGRKLKTIHKYINKELSKSKWESKRSILNYIKVACDLAISIIKYNITISEYVTLNFYDLNNQRRSKIITKNMRDNFIRNFNDKDDIPKLGNKINFLRNFKPYINREFLLLEEATIEEFSMFYSKHNRFIAKNSQGMQGKNIHIITDIEDIQNEFLRLKNYNIDIIEEISETHPNLDLINPVGLPPIRLMTFIDKNGEAHLIASAIYFSVNDPVVNSNRGASMALIDPDKGKIITDALTPEKKLISRHLVSNVTIKNFQVPKWDELKKWYY